MFSNTLSLLSSRNVSDQVSVRVYSECSVGGTLGSGPRDYSEKYRSHTECKLLGATLTEFSGVCEFVGLNWEEVSISNPDDNTMHLASGANFLFVLQYGH